MSRRVNEHPRTCPLDAASKAALRLYSSREADWASRRRRSRAANMTVSVRSADRYMMRARENGVVGKDLQMGEAKVVTEKRARKGMGQCLLLTWANLSRPKARPRPGHSMRPQRLPPTGWRWC